MDDEQRSHRGRVVDLAEFRATRNQEGRLQAQRHLPSLSPPLPLRAVEHRRRMLLHMQTVVARARS